MKLSKLLSQREALLRQMQLVNLAFAYDKLADFAGRISRARLAGEVQLCRIDPSVGRYWPTLTALEGSQSVIEEHFTDADLMVLADIIAFLAAECDPDLTFRIEELPEQFLAPLRQELAEAGVSIDHNLLLTG